MNAEALIARKLQAQNELRALPIAATQHAHVAGGALVLAMRKMASEHATMHAACLGPVGQPPSVCVVIPDPRDRDRQYQAFLALARPIVAYLHASVAVGRLPQIIVPSGSHAENLEFVAMRMCRADGAQHADPALTGQISQLGLELAFYAQRRHLPGQQVILAATDLLTEHYCFGQPEQRNEHLGSLLHWLTWASTHNGPLDEDTFYAELEALEREYGTGATPLPALDAALMPAFRKYVAAKRRKDPTGMGAAERDLAEGFIDSEGNAVPGLKADVQRLYAQTQQALAILQAANLPELQGVAHFVAADSEEAAEHIGHVSGGGRIAWTDREARNAARALQLREAAVTAWSSALLHGEPVERELALLDGELIRGEVTRSSAYKIGRRNFYDLELRSAHDRCRVREGDVVAWCEEPRLTLRISETAWQSDGSLVVRCTGLHGHTKYRPAIGDVITVGPPPTRLQDETGRIYRLIGGYSRQRGSLRTATPLPPSPPPNDPDQPLAALR
jgi:hypothetical protein